MAAGMQFVASGDGKVARDIVLDTFKRYEWRVQLKGEWEGVAERGSKAASFWGGAMAGKGGRYVELKIKVSANAQGNAVIDLIEGKSGMSGGLIGISQAKEVYQNLYDAVGGALTSAGIFVANTKI